MYKYLTPLTLALFKGQLCLVYKYSVSTDMEITNIIKSNEAKARRIHSMQAAELKLNPGV